MKLFFAFCLSFWMSTFVMAQFNPEAIDIIRPISESILSSSGVSADFIIEIENKQTDTSDEEEGTIQIKENRFKLFVMGTETYFDGETQWVHMLEEKEVNISIPDTTEDIELTPFGIFRLYEKGFRFQIIDDNEAESTIDMIPDDRESAYFKIRLVLDKKMKLFKQVIAYGRDGLNTTLSIRNMQKDLNYKPQDFVFNEAENSEVEIIDMR